jgi:hypothetical protein
MARLQQKKLAESPQVQPRPPAMREHRRRFDTSVGVSGPRDLTVRIDVVRRRENEPRCNIDTPTASRRNVRDDSRSAPLLEAGRHQEISFLKNEREIFFAGGLDRGDPFEAACKMSFLAQAIWWQSRIDCRNGQANRTSAPAIAQVSRPSGSWMAANGCP